MKDKDMDKLNEALDRMSKREKATGIEFAQAVLSVLQAERDKKIQAAREEVDHKILQLEKELKEMEKNCVPLVLRDDEDTQLLRDLVARLFGQE